jgi:hypothetical protein
MLSSPASDEVLLTAFTVREVRLRGMLATRRAAEATWRQACEPVTTAWLVVTAEA